MKLAMARGSLEDAQALIGTEIARLAGADPVNAAMIRHQVEAFEWAFPPGTAAGQSGHPALRAPSSMYMTFGMPAYWSAGAPPIADLTLAPLAFGTVPAPGSAMMATATSVEFHEPMYEGDRISSVWRLTGVTPKTLGIGTGAFLNFEITYEKSDGTLVAVERTSVFRYDPANSDPA
jgi:3-methylfumaryl-CoA hydratase